MIGIGITKAQEIFYLNIWEGSEKFRKAISVKHYMRVEKRTLMTITNHFISIYMAFEIWTFLILFRLHLIFLTPVEMIWKLIMNNSLVIHRHYYIIGLQKFGMNYHSTGCGRMGDVTTQFQNMTFWMIKVNAIRKYVFYKQVRRKIYAFPQSIKTFCRRLHKIHLCCHMNGFLSCFRNEYKIFLKKYREGVKHFLGLQRIRCTVGKKSPQFWELFEKKIWAQ